MLNSHIQSFQYMGIYTKTTALDIAEAIIKSSCAILASSVAVWEPGLCKSVSTPEEPLV